MQTGSETTAKTSSPPDALPPGVGSALLFAAFNALSFPLVVGSPMILYAKSLGAPATVLGIIAGMMPLLVIFQIPAAKHVGRIGYKRFVYAGWGVRIIFIFGLALVPLLSGLLNTTAQLALVLLLLFAFNLSRGISSCAWLPWITALVPAKVRGKYLARDAAAVNLASFVITLVAAACLGSAPAAWQFAVLFALSGAMGATSLVVLKQIPDVSAAEDAAKSSEPVPWKEIASYPPFRQLLIFNVAWAAAVGGLGAFTVAWLKSEAQMSEAQVLLLTSAAFLGGLSSLWLLGTRLDRFGSKPALFFALLLWFGIAAGWMALAGGALQVQIWLVLALQFFMGLATALVNMANVRLAMATVPVMGRSHFFALFSVAGSLTLGIAPVLWGVLIDALQSVRWETHGFVWNRYSIFFAAVAAVFVVAMWRGRRLHEPAAAQMEDLLRDVIEQSPFRMWLRYWPRS